MKISYLMLIFIYFTNVTPVYSADEYSRSVSSFEGIDLVTKNKISLHDKKNLVIVFLSAKCPCSNSHVNELAKLSSEFKNFKFIGVHSNLNENADETTEYFKMINLPFAVIQDINFKYANSLKALKTPHVFLFDKNEKIVFQGGISNSQSFNRAEQNYLRDALNDITNNRPIKIAHARTLGCIISRGEKNVW